MDLLKFLFIEFDTTAKLGIARLHAFEETTLNGEHIRARSTFFSFGEYSWLREAPDSIIGLRWDIDPGTDIVLEDLIDRSYLEKMPQTNSVNVFFGSSRVFDARISADHDIGEQRIYVNDSGLLCCGFEVNLLSGTELRGLGL